MTIKTIRHLLLLAVGALLMPMLPALADNLPPPPTGYAQDMDPVQHTQAYLDHLKTKLNLTPAQADAWATWSSGVTDESKKQAERMKDWHQKMQGDMMHQEEGSTPDRMARGIEHMRGEVTRMQEHVTRMEAALERTKTFYAALDTNQKTIFDLSMQHGHHGWHGGHDGQCGPQDHDAGKKAAHKAPGNAR